MNIIKRPIDEIIKDNSLEFGNYVIKQRAIPDLRDGMKPVHKRILYAMHTMKAYDYIKSQNISGQVTKLHPHGDCLAGDTKIKLLSGEVKTFKELEQEGKSHWVLSVDDDGKIVPAMAHSFRKVKRVNKLKVIKFANGYEIKSTDDHKFRLINGEWIEAKDIKPGHIIDYGVIKYDKYLDIFGNKTKSTPIHHLVNDYFEGKFPKGYIRHHIDKNKHNNNPDNLQRLSLSEHLKIHNEEENISQQGAKKSYNSLFSKEGKYYEKNRRKNSKLAKSLNEKTGLVRANATLSKMESLGIELTEENYEGMRGKVYNLTRISTLIKRGYITDFEDLVAQYKKGIKFIEYVKEDVDDKKGKAYRFKNKSKEHKEKCKQSYEFARRINGLKKSAINNNFNLNVMKNTKSYCVADAIPTVIETYYIDVDEIVYDFSVENTHNALISISDDDTLFAVAHNCYPTMVTMAQSDGNLTPYIEGKGNFSQHTSRDLQFGASRYTESRLSNMAKDILKDLNKDIVDFIPNYDGTTMMPEVLPVKFPAVLHYAQEGIAYSMASKIPSFNLKELNDAAIKYIKEGITTILIPDFATGGYIINQPQAFEKINETGLGSIRLRAKATIDKNTISITEIPYSTTREAIIDKVIELIKSGKLKEITDIKDLTGLYGMEIEITCKKNTDMELLLEKLYLLTPMESSYSCNMNVLHEGLPKVMGVWEIINKWFFWRKECVKRGLRNEISDLEKKLHLLKGLEKVLLDIDKAIEIIRYSADEHINYNLINYFNIDQVQADYVSNMKLRNINKDYIAKQIKDIENLENKLKDLHNTLNCEHLIRDLICEGIQEVTDKYAQDRRTKLITICEKTKEKAIKVKKEIPDYKVRLIVTREGYVKKLSPNSKAEQNLKPSDEIVQVYETTNLSELVVFSGKDAYKIKLHQLNDCKPNQLGDYLPNVLGIKDILGYTIVDDKYKYTLILYSNGKIAKIDNSSYKTETNRKKLANSLYKDADVLQVLTIQDDCDINLVNNKGKKTMKNTNILTPKKSRNTQGVSTLKNIVGIEII